VLVQMSEDGRIRHIQAFPSTSQYSRGRFVTWEWDFTSGVEGQTWFREPATGNAISAFASSLTFAGREYPREWTLERRLPNPNTGLSDSGFDTA
jgi:hypothetical protein